MEAVSWRKKYIMPKLLFSKSNRNFSLNKEQSIMKSQPTEEAGCWSLTAAPLPFGGMATSQCTPCGRVQSNFVFSDP